MKKYTKGIIISAFIIAFAAFSGWAFMKTTPEENVSSIQSEKSEIEWLTIEEAYKRNQKEPRKIFVDVYTDWCGWCKVMDKNTFKNKDVVAYTNDNFYAVKLNAESSREFEIAGTKLSEAAVAQQFRVSSYPTIVFIEEDFQTIFPMPGYREPVEFLGILKQFKEGKSK